MASIELAAAKHLARIVALLGPEEEKERVLVLKKARKQEQWRLGGGPRIPQPSEKQSFQERAAGNTRTVLLARSCVQSIDAPPSLKTCNRIPIHFSDFANLGDATALRVRARFRYYSRADFFEQ